MSEKDTFWITLHQTIISNPQYQKRLAKRKSDYEKRKKAEATGEYFEIEGDGKYEAVDGNIGKEANKPGGLNFLPRTSFEVKKDQKNVFLIEDPDSDDQESPDLVAPVIIHRMSDEKERPNISTSPRVKRAVEEEAI